MKQFFKTVFAKALGLILGTFISLLLLPVLIVIVIKLFQGGGKPIEENSILHLDLHGTLVDKERPLDFELLFGAPFSPNARTTGLYELTRALKIAKKDSRIKGLYVELGNLEAGWASVETLRRAILDFKSSGKFVYAYSELMDEHTYYLATAAEQIFLQPNGDLEFNGLAISEPFLKGLLQKLEVEPRIFRVGKFKAAVEPLILEKMSEDNRQQNQVLVNDIWTVAREAFRKPGKLDDAKLDELASNLEINSAADAQAAGLVTKLAYEDEVLDLLAEKTVGADEDVRYATPGQILRATPPTSGSAKDKIAIIFAEGEIVSGLGDLDTVGSDSFVESLDEARSDENVKAIVVRINSPGGDALASDVMWRELRVTDDEVPVVASMGDVAASGGYYMAAGARHIIAEAGTITGSIGVFGILIDSQNFFRNKLGVNFDRVTSHPYADIGNPNREMTEFERKKIQSSVERVYGRFISVVRESRGFPEAQSDSGFAEGRVWSGLRAKELKLVDQLGGLDSAIAKAAELAKVKTYELDIYPREQAPFERLLHMVSGETVKLILRGTPFEQAQESLKALPRLKSGIYSRMPFDFKIQ